MQSELQVINNRFKDLTDFEDIAILLEIPVEFLWKILIRNKQVNYRMFKLRKKNGNERTIYSPISNLAILQKKLKYILSLNYKSHYRSHGFVKNRGIVTNASIHIKKKYVLNFDLKDFFESIKFRRVRAMFITYFKFNDSVATTLANICCHPDGFLPQGAPTSPIISNIIANRLDKELTSIATNTKWCQYTRYADDITFSTNMKSFPTEIAYIKDGSVLLNQNIVELVEKQGFLINDQKTRLQNHKQNQSVTGITVNEKRNVSRKYIRRIRSILHCIEKNINNIDIAKKIFIDKYPFRQKKKGKNPNMFLILKGMISHVGHVKGKEDPLYIKLAGRFNEVVKASTLNPIKIETKIETKRTFHENHTFVIDDSNNWSRYMLKDGEGFDDIGYGQGTGFLLKNIGLVTNAHVIEYVLDVIKDKGRFLEEFYIGYYKSIETNTKQWAKVDCYDINKDIAILSLKDTDMSEIGYSYNDVIETGQKIDLIGYPDFKIGNEIRIQTGKVQGRITHIGEADKVNYNRYEITNTIFGGNSGGPIVNTNNEVVGVAVQGSGAKPNGIIPISDVIELAKNRNTKDLIGVQ